jgi:hypothetical protein
MTNTAFHFCGQRFFSFTVTNGNNYSYYNYFSVAKQYEGIESGGSEHLQLQ